MVFIFGEWLPYHDAMERQCYTVWRPCGLAPIRLSLDIPSHWTVIARAEDAVDVP